MKIRFQIFEDTNNNEIYLAKVKEVVPSSGENIIEIYKLNDNEFLDTLNKKEKQFISAEKGFAKNGIALSKLEEVLKKGENNGL